MTTRPGSELLRTLRRIERARWRRAAIVTVLSTLGWGMTVACVLATGAGLLWLPALVRWVLLASAAVLLTWVARGRRALAWRSPADTARTLESAAPTLERRLRPAVDLAYHVPVGTSTDLAALAQEQALARLQGVDTYGLVGARAPLPLRPLALGALAVLFVAGASGGRPMVWLNKSLPWRDPPAPAPLLVQITPGDTSVVGGTTVTVRCAVHHLGSGGAVVEVRRPGHMDEDVALTATHRLGSRTDLSASLRSPGGDYQYRVILGDTASSWFAVEEYQSLQITNARLTYRYPPYTDLDSLVVDGLPREIRALRGTRVALTLRANNPLAGCVCQQWTEPSCSLTVVGQTASGQWVASTTANPQFIATDRFGQHASLGPVPVYVTADDPPTIDTIVPGCDTLLSRDVTAAVGVSAHDDFGLAAVTVRYTHAEREDTLLIARGRLGAQGNWVRTWDLSPLDLLPEDVVAYRFEVMDNDAVSGPKVTTTQWFRLRFPALEEIIASIGQEQSGIIDSLEALSGEGSDLQEELRTIAAELAGAESADWGTKDDLRALAAQQRAMGERLAQVADELARLERTATEEELFTAQVMDRVATVQELLQNLQLPELERALEELQEAIDTVSPQELEQELARLAAHQTQILESLDRAIEMLRKLEVAQRLSSLTRAAERLQNEQERVMETPPSASQADQETQLGQELGRVEQSLGELAEEMRALSPAVADSLASAMKRVQQSEAKDALEQAASALRAGSSQAQDLEAKALAGIQQLTADLQAAEESMGGQDMAQMMEELSHAEAAVSDLAFEQEQLATTPGETVSERGRQKGVAEALRLLREQVEETLSKGLGPAAADVLGTMARAQNDVDRAVASGSRAMADRNAALRALNAVSGSLSALRQSMESTSCSSASGMEDLFGLSQAQGTLNRSCQSLLPRAGGLSRQLLSSLAARQQLIREQLSRLGQGRQATGSVSGDLGGIGQEMEEIVGQLEQRGLDKETIERQQRVLSRLLDAQRSVRRQGFARRRMSEPARAQQTSPGDGLPGAVPAPVGAPPSRREDPYPSAYREAIEAYFRAISQPRP